MDVRNYGIESEGDHMKNVFLFIVITVRGMHNTELRRVYNFSDKCAFSASQ